MERSFEEQVAEARQNVIDAVRDWKPDFGNGCPGTTDEIYNAICALDKIENPDPWELIARFRDDLPSMYWDTGNPAAPGHMIDAQLKVRGLR